MYLQVKEVIAAQGYLLEILYENGELRQFDMNPYLEIGIFKELKDEQIFNQVKPSFDTVEWPNQADIDPDVLYNESLLVNKKSS